MRHRFAALLASLGLSLSACAATSATKAGEASTVTGASLCTATVARTWHGRVLNARADEYTKYISEAIIKFRAIPGNRGYQLMKDTIGKETHFTVISYWDSPASITAYAGADITKTRHLPRDAEFLIEPEPTVKNYSLVVNDLDCPERPSGWIGN